MRVATSLRCCLRCNNVYKTTSDVAALVGGVDITCADHRRFEARSNHEMYTDVDVVNEIGRRVTTGTMRPVRLEEIQKASGQNSNAEGFVSDVELRTHCPALDVLTQDWVHGFLSDGVLSTEMWKMMSSSSQQRGITMEDWNEFLQADWKFPAHYQTKGAVLWRVFDLEHRYPDDPNRIRGDASELLGLFALMRHFIELNFAGIAELASECRSYEACCAVVDLILAAKQGVVDVTSAAVRDRMQDAISAHLTCHMEAYGTGSVKPKHHLNHCLPRQFWRKRRVTDAFFMERLHLRVKPHAELMKNTATFELSVLGRVMQKQITTLKDGWIKSGLRGRIVENILPGVRVSTSMDCASQKVSVGDVVCVLPDLAGEACAQIINVKFDKNTCYVFVGAIAERCLTNTIHVRLRVAQPTTAVSFSLS